MVSEVVFVSEIPVEEPEHVSCELCHKEVPRADSLNVEGKEYIYYFCGHGCYSRWTARVKEQPQRKSPK